VLAVLCAARRKDVDGSTIQAVTPQYARDITIPVATAQYWCGKTKAARCEKQREGDVAIG
jgi:hypothetical protein